VSENPSSNAFAQLVKLPDPAIPLAHAALLLASDEYPGLDVDAYLRRLEALAAHAPDDVHDSDPEKSLLALGQYLFVRSKFAGNTDNYYDPRNSYLNDVLDRRLGIPITLSVIMIDVAARLNIPVRGVGLPGHFVVRHTVADPPLFADPFHHGHLLSALDCHEFAAEIFNDQVRMSPEVLEPVGNLHILQRMLVNLKVIYAQSSDHPRTARVITRIIQTQQHSPHPALFRERGISLMQMNQMRAALCDLTHYLELAPDATDSDVVQRQIELLLGQLQQLN
jgi:regulator of sirC expression with transglutaminase-like and TPR domain